MSDANQTLGFDPDQLRAKYEQERLKRMDNSQVLTQGGYQEEDLVTDNWTEIIRKFISTPLTQDSPALSPEATEKQIELTGFGKVEQIRSPVDEFVDDPRVAGALKPYHRQLCKRPCIHNDYLPAFNRDNVTLVRTDGKGAERIPRRGVVVAGQEYELGCLIFASGFEVGTDYTRRGGYELIDSTDGR
ncbi:MAG: hypothetical protein CL931_16865 [Deltaproteobacteria bacterium]|nr:hypothetical protein [Deltaproteobacteria bacterium]